MTMTNPNIIDLEAAAHSYREADELTARRVIICAGTGCVANGALKVRDAFVKAIAERGLNVKTELKAEEADENPRMLVTKSGCQGFCQMGPLVSIEPDNLMYVHVKPEDVEEIVRETLVLHEPVERLLYRDQSSGEVCPGEQDITFYKRQQRTVLKDCGHIDPENLEEYVARGGYRMAREAFLETAPEAICETVAQSGLRGRGGGGFPTGKKWQLTLAQQSEKKYVVCNGDEGDPGAFMDRSIMEGNPHALLEGIMITAKAIGADEAYIYVRAEYPLAVKRVRKAVRDAVSVGILGDHVFGGPDKLHIEVMEGAGAFVCGEETALIASVEGRRGMPSPKPPFPAEKGLWGKPTVINNVETLATIPLILRDGPQAFRSRGTENSPGTKTFALTGHVANTGLIEVPFGTTLREIVFEIGGGVTGADGKLDPEGFKAVQIGGPSGGCLTEEHLDLPLDFDSLRQAGAMVGSGGLVVMNQQTCMVSVARFFMQFTQNESCGKCVPCREGTKQMLALLDEVMSGEATANTLDLLERLARTVGRASLCGLGKTAPSPVLSTLRQFRGEYEAHVFGKSCPAGECAALADFTVNANTCAGCGKCIDACPVHAISGKAREPHVIDAETCIKCGSCLTACTWNAIERG
jgi:NADH-quinone oxidoreductase subunit F